MSLFKNLFKNTRKLTEAVARQTNNYQHNIYQNEISQYSPLPRYYYIQGKCYDIDSPESVHSIPICSTKFNINDDVWGIDTVLREHVNRYFSKIPDVLKDACYNKISELEHSGYMIESSAERNARLKQQQEQRATEKRVSAINLDDMRQFHINQFELNEIIHLSDKAIMLLNKADQQQASLDIALMNSYIDHAKKLATIEHDICIPVEQLEFSSKECNLGRDESYTQYYTYFVCSPYTPSGKLSKYPLTLHYATNRLNEFNPPENYFGSISYMKNGNIGKAVLTNWVAHSCYIIKLDLYDSTLQIKSIECNKNGVRMTLYKSK